MAAAATSSRSQGGGSLQEQRKAICDEYDVGSFATFADFVLRFVAFNSARVLGSVLSESAYSPAFCLQLLIVDPFANHPDHDPRHFFVNGE